MDILSKKKQTEYGRILKETEYGHYLSPFCFVTCIFESMYVVHLAIPLYFVRILGS